MNGKESFKYLLETPQGEKWNVEFDHEPSTEEMNRALEGLRNQGTIRQGYPGWVNPLKTGTELLGLTGGAVLGMASPLGPLGSPVGAGLGYSGMKGMTDYALELLNIQKPKTLGERSIQAGMDVPIGMATEMAGQVTPKLMSGLGKIGASAWGAYTGSGRQAITGAFEGKPGFTQFMRRQGSEATLVEQSRSGLDELVHERAETYKDLFSKIKQIKRPINPNEVRDAATTTLRDFNLKTTQSAGNIGKPIWQNTRFSTNKTAQEEIETSLKTINDWTDFSPEGVNELKQAIDNLYRRSQPEASAFVSKLRNKINDILLNKVPEYRELNKLYKTDTATITEIQKDLALGDTTTKLQSLKRLLSVLKNDDDFAVSLLSKLDEKSGKTLIPSLQGIQMQSFIPTSLVGRMGGMYQLLQGVTKLDMNEIAGLLASSPRLTGEFLHYFGKIAPKLQKGTRVLPQTIQSVYQKREE